MTWTVFAGNVLCGGCGDPIAAGDPVGLRLGGKLRRCVLCAGKQHDVVDWAQVDAARHALAARFAAEREAPKPVTYATRRSEDGFQALADIAPAAPSTRVLPFHDLPAKVRRSHNALTGND